MLYKRNRVIDKIKIHIYVTLVALKTPLKKHNQPSTQVSSVGYCVLFPQRLAIPFGKKWSWNWGWYFLFPVPSLNISLQCSDIGDKVMLLRHPSKSGIFRVPAVTAHVSVNKTLSGNFGKENCCWLKLFKQETWSCVWEFGFTPGILEGHEGERPSRCCIWCWMVAVALFLKIVQVFTWKPIFFPRELDAELYKYTSELFAVLGFHS